jgi:vacuolar-type H+-ATPase subunit E/Vma4
VKLFDAWRRKQRLKRKLLELAVDRMPLVEELVDHWVNRLEEWLDAQNEKSDS